MIWLIGSNGMLGNEFLNLFKNSNKELLITHKNKVDITNFNELNDFAAGKHIDWIINCSAYTAVDKAESKKDAAYKLNVTGVENIARIAKEKNATIIHFSTDYIFDGEKSTAYTEDDAPNPKSVYGKTKLEGENSIKHITDRFFIIRTSWMYGKNGNNFLKTMIRLFREKKEVSVISDQKGSPTCCYYLAKNIVSLIGKDSKKYGIYNYSDEGEISWYDFAAAIYNETKEKGIIENNPTILPITTDEYPTPAQRPKNSLLSKEKVKRELNFKVRNWHDNLKEYINKEYTTVKKLRNTKK